MMLFLMLWTGSGYLGVRILRPALRPTLEPEIPPARVANTEGAEYAYQRTTDLASRGSRKLGKVISIALGVFLLIWPVLVIYWLFTMKAGFGAF
jgi:hypothetical protein